MAEQNPLDAIAPGAGAAAQIGRRLAQRAITYGGLAGTAAAALLETLTEEEDED